MPLTPTDATLAVRAAATINKNALDSVAAQIVDHCTEIAGWPATPAKGLMRDHLSHTLADVRHLARRMVETVRLSNVVLDMFGTGGVDPPVPAITWSTGNW